MTDEFPQIIDNPQKLQSIFETAYTLPDYLEQNNKQIDYTEQLLYAGLNELKTAAIKFISELLERGVVCETSYAVDIFQDVFSLDYEEQVTLPHGDEINKNMT